ncbi:MAG TPA: polysulfide reductase NrfD [Aquifex aeolicus]|uniref:Polysulfide reductase NrfD n=1 Tax=Aquifex aeolicus TaxID=63363 RepID=A0A9D1CEK2_AQUAO|nr:polysulfide reductase NrfD [Aquificales bacterium]HIP97975.1 polysulfide reductase NrfD [Aquifex aeolicus]HIQ26286.1 polysulfide reductase NrfD [Aquifex aeolicus]
MVGIDFHQLLTFEPQQSWHLGIAIYLFLGGLGGAMGFLAAVNHLIFKNRDPVMHFWGVLLGILLVNFGAIFLLLHMLQPFKFILATFGAIVFNGNFHPWILWGADIIILFSTFGILWALTYVKEVPGLKKIGFLVALSEKLKGFENALAWLTFIFGIGAFTYTGFLLSVAPSIPAWSHPLVPILFAVSALSTATAYYMLYTFLFKGRSEEERQKRDWWSLFNEKLDITLIVAELIILGSYFNYLYYATAGGKYVFEKVMGDIGFWVLFMFLGLIVPLVLEIVAVRKHVKILIPVAAILVIFGGFLLRYYILHYGIYTYPWPS